MVKSRDIAGERRRSLWHPRQCKGRQDGSNKERPQSAPASQKSWTLVEHLFFFFFFAFHSCISGVHHFWVRFLRMWPFFNPTIKVVTFRLRGWCVLGVVLLPAFTRLGHERQDLLSLYDGMHVCTDYTSVYTLIRRSFWGNGVWTHVNSKGKIRSTRKCPQRRIEPATLWTASPSTTNWAIPAREQLSN